jgi:hypothetical protein
MANPVTLTRTISGTPDMRVLIENGQFARPLLFGTTWNEIRIGIRWHMRDSGANLASNPQVFLGVCSGDTNLWGDATTTHAVGINFNAATWTRNTTNYQVSGVNTIFPAKRVGSTITRGSTTSTAWAIGNQAAADAADRTVLFCQILKGSPNYSIRSFHRNTTSSTPPADISSATFLTEMNVLGTPVITNHVFSAGVNLAVNEGTDGALDHVAFSWDRTTGIEICDIAVARIS